MDRGAWWATVQEVSKRWTRLSDSLLLLRDSQEEKETHEVQNHFHHANCY